MENYKVIDINTWERKQHFELFRQFQQPRYDISMELDITNFYTCIKEQKLPFTFAIMYAIASCANEITEFRYRFLEDQVVLFQTPKISFTYLNKETNLLKNVVVEMKDNIEDFVMTAKEIAQNQKEYFTGPMGNDVYQFSSIPWIHFTHISHTESGKKNNATPMFDFGRYLWKEGRLMLPFAIQAHHSFVDGIHMGKLVESLQEYLDQY